MDTTNRFAGLVFLGLLALAAIYLLRVDWVKRRSRFGRPAAGVVIKTVAWAIVWSLAYTWVGLWSVTALGVLLLSLYVGAEFWQFGGETSSWGTLQQIADGAFAATMMAAPTIFAIVMLNGAA